MKDNPGTVGYDGITARVELDSLHPENPDCRLTTMVCTFPRFILAEFNTHRAFSRNSASSRAIPFRKLAAAEYYIPPAIAQNKPGMQAFEDPAPSWVYSGFLAGWVRARHAIIKWATYLAGEEIGAKSPLKIHKQWVNRLLEPWMMHTVIVTATDWWNFFYHRVSPAAQPEMQVLAIKMYKAFMLSIPEVRELHTPFLDTPGFHAFNEQMAGALSDEYKEKISVARCARVSYLNHDRNEEDLEGDVRLFNDLMKGEHPSPLEHVARPWRAGDPGGYLPYRGNFWGWESLRARYTRQGLWPNPIIDKVTLEDVQAIIAERYPDGLMVLGEYFGEVDDPDTW